jgi:DNA adenine methylase
VPLQLRYSIGTGDSRGKQAGELIIKNWDDSQAMLI